MDIADQTPPGPGTWNDDGTPDTTAFDAGIGWRVLDPEGNVVASGPIMVMESVAQVEE